MNRNGANSIADRLMGLLMCAPILALLLTALSFEQVIAQPPAGGLLYSEDFDAGLARGWDLEPAWTLVDGALRGEGGGRARYGGGRWENARIAFTFQTDEARVLFNASERGYYIARFLQRGNQLLLDLGKRVRFESGINRIGSGTIDSSPGSRYQVEIVTHEGQIRISVNGHNLISQADQNPLSLGTIAFEVSDDGYAVVDNIVVTQSDRLSVETESVGAFTGRVFEGDAGDTTRPISGVTVSLYGSNDPETEGTLLQTTSTGPNGRFNLPIGLVNATYEFFSIRSEDLPGYTSSGAFGPGASVINENWIEHLGPADGRTRGGNIFWDQIERPDLVIDAADCEVIEDGNVLLIIAEVWNSGTAPAPAVAVHATSDDWTGQASVRPLRVRGYERIEIRLEIPDEQRGTTRVFRTVVDPQGEVEELSEANNELMTGGCEIPELPDLAMELPSIRILDDARTIRIEAPVSNVGGSPSPATLVRAESEPWREEVLLRSLPARSGERVEFTFTIPNEERGNEHRFQITVDPEERVRESNEGNNYAEAPSLRIPHLPDLVVRSVRREIVGDGRSVRIVSEIGNSGGAGARAIAVRAESADWSSTGSHAELAAGATANVTITLEIPGGHRGEEHAFEVIVDPENRIIELNENNNSLDTDALDIPELPDLRVLEPFAEILDDARVLRIGADIANVGGASALGASIQVSSETWEMPAGESRPLSAGESTPVELSLEIPNDQRGRSHRFEIVIDPDNAITELREDNNRSVAGELHIPDLPDLLIRNLRARIEEGEGAVLIGLDVVNQGTTVASASLVRVMADGWATTEQTVRALAVDSSSSVTCRMEILGEHRGNTHQFEVSLDPDRIIVELDETNNIESTSSVPIGRWRPPLWASLAVVVLVLGGIAFTILRGGRIRRRKEWQKKAKEGELPESCEPCTRTCRKIQTELETPDRSIMRLALRTTDSESGAMRGTTNVKGKGVDRLNETLDARRRGEAPEALEARVAPLSDALLGEILKWLRRQTGLLDISIVAYLEGGRVTCEFTLYHCKRKGRDTFWDEEDKWTAVVKDERDEPIGTLRLIDPAVQETRAQRAGELTGLLMQFLERV